MYGDHKKDRAVFVKGLVNDGGIKITKIYKTSGK